MLKEKRHFKIYKSQFTFSPAGWASYWVVIWNFLPTYFPLSIFVHVLDRNKIKNLQKSFPHTVFGQKNLTLVVLKLCKFSTPFLTTLPHNSNPMTFRFDKVHLLFDHLRNLWLKSNQRVHHRIGAISHNAKWAYSLSEESHAIVHSRASHPNNEIAIVTKTACMTISCPLFEIQESLNCILFSLLSCMTMSFVVPDVCAKISCRVCKRKTCATSAQANCVI